MGLSAIVDRAVLSLQRHPTWLRNAVRLVGGVGRIEALRRSHFAVSNSAVREIFDRPQDFLLGYRNERKLMLGPFLLGMDPGPRYVCEKEALTRWMVQNEPHFPAIVGPIADAEAAALVPTGPTLELAGYAERVLTRSLCEFFGVPPNGAQSEHLDAAPGVESMALFIRTMGVTIASPDPAPFALRELACRVRHDFRRQLEAAANQQQPTGLVAFLLQNGWATDDVVRMVAGMMSASAGFPKAFAHVLYELRCHEQLAVVQQAAAAGSRNRVDAYVREALRFRPAFPLLVRHCPRGTVLRGADDEPPTEVPAGRNLSFSPLTAMFDPRAVERPEEFIPGRPDHAYLLFGDGTRRCIGEGVIMSLFLPMLRALFQRVPAVVNAPAGRFRYDAVGLDRYVVRLP